MSAGLSESQGASDGSARSRRVAMRAGVASEPLLARVRSMLGARARRRAESLDFVQEAWAEFLASPAADTSLDDDEFVRRFCAIARNNVRDAGRRKHAPGFDSVADASAIEARLEAGSPSPASVVEREEQLALLARATGALPEELRSIVSLHIGDGMSFSEIGRRLGRNEDTVRKAYYRVVLALSRDLAR